MPDTLDANGLTVKTLTELVTELTDDLKGIYGSDINVSSNSPDGQQINIYCQAGVDLREVLQKVYNSFDPDLAEGRSLDQRVAINNIKRKQGTFTFTNIDITLDRATNLVGLDGDANELEPDITDLFTVKDDEGNQFYLLSSQSEASAGTYTYSFRAADLGEVLTTPNTITTPVTIIQGVTVVNNPSSASSVGINEETDIELRVRRRASTTIAATGPVDSLEAALNDLELITFAKVYENTGNSVDGDGIPAHGIWVIVEGGDPDEIGETIYKKRIMGVPMKGSETVAVTRPDGSTFTAAYDNPIDESIYIQFTISLPNGYIDEDGIKASIVSNLFWEIGGDADAGTVWAYLKGLNENYIIEDLLLSTDDIYYYEVVSPSSKQHRFVNATARITITT